MSVALNDISLFDDDLDATLRAWREAIERANNVTGGGVLQIDEGPAGFVFFVPNQEKPRAMAAVVLTGGISAAVGDTLGEGTIMLRRRNGADLEDWKEAHCYSNFTFAIPETTRLGVVPDGDDWQIPGAQYCPPSGGA